MRAPTAVPAPGSKAVPTAAPATAPAGKVTLTALVGPLISSGTPTMPSTKSTASSALICRLASTASPEALSTPDLALMLLKLTTMPWGVFCVFMLPDTVSSGVCPAWSLPAVRTALFRSKRSKVAGAMAKLVWV